MSVSSRKEEDKDKEDIIDKDGVHLNDEDGVTKKKYVKLWRIEASREFVIFMVIIVFAIGTSLYNPLKIQEVSQQNQEISLQNREYNQQNLNGTERIIELLTNQDTNRTDSSIEIIKLLLLFDQEHQRDHIEIMKGHNISNDHFVDVNNTHAITEKGSFKIPYNLSLSLVFNQTLQDR